MDWRDVRGNGDFLFCASVIVSCLGSAGFGESVVPFLNRARVVFRKNLRHLKGDVHDGRNQHGDHLVAVLSELTIDGREFVLHAACHVLDLVLFGFQLRQTKPVSEMAIYLPLPVLLRICV